MTRSLPLAAAALIALCLLASVRMDDGKALVDCQKIHANDYCLWEFGR